MLFNLASLYKLSHLSVLSYRASEPLSVVTRQVLWSWILWLKLQQYHCLLQVSPTSCWPPDDTPIVYLLIGGSTYCQLTRNVKALPWPVQKLTTGTSKLQRFPAFCYWRKQSSNSPRMKVRRSDTTVWTLQLSPWRPFSWPTGLLCKICGCCNLRTTFARKK